VLSGCSLELRAELRESIIGMILATDMQFHFKHIAVLQSAIDAKRATKGWFSAASRADRQLLLGTALHAADISGSAKPFALNQEWGMRVMEEFWAQGDIERARGWTVSPMMDRLKGNPEKSVPPPTRPLFARCLQHSKSC
jgi:hypothetical protein